MAAKTGAQSPGVCWRNRRWLGYQGEVSPARPQRQSDRSLSATQAGRAKAPREVGEGVVGGDDEIEARHDGGGIDEGIGALVDTFQRLDRQVAELLEAVAPLERDQPRARNGVPAVVRQQQVGGGPDVAAGGHERSRSRAAVASL